MPKTKKSRSKPAPARSGPVALPTGCEVLLGRAQIVAALGISMRTFQGMISKGEYPPPDTKIGALPRWRVETHNAWVRSRCPGTDEG